MISQMEIYKHATRRESDLTCKHKDMDVNSYIFVAPFGFCYRMYICYVIIWLCPLIFWGLLEG